MVIPAHPNRDGVMPRATARHPIPAFAPLKARPSATGRLRSTASGSSRPSRDAHRNPLSDIRTSTSWQVVAVRARSGYSGHLRTGYFTRASRSRIESSLNSSIGRPIREVAARTTSKRQQGTIQLAASLEPFRQQVPDSKLSRAVEHRIQTPQHRVARRRCVCRNRATGATDGDPS